MKISFCTPVCNRLYQLIETFDHNCKVISENKDTEWIILNFASHDGLHDFMISRLNKISTRIVYAKDTSNRMWHMSSGKNSAHAVASGNVLVNMDCDNYIDPNVDIIKTKFQSGTQILRTWTGIYGDGTCGRVSIDKDSFYKLGGYDENFYPAGYQDIDIFKRAIALKLRHDVHVSTDYRAIKNDKIETIKNTGMSNIPYKFMNEENEEMSKHNIKNKILKVNLPHGFFIPKVEIFKGELDC